MEENTLLKISLVFSFIGLIILYFLSNTSIPITYNPGLDHNEGDFVKAIGIISQISEREDVVFIEMNQYTPLKVVVFDDKIEGIKVGDEIEVIGSTEQYKGEDEIIASKIRKIK